MKTNTKVVLMILAVSLVLIGFVSVSGADSLVKRTSPLQAIINPEDEPEGETSPMPDPDAPWPAEDEEGALSEAIVRAGENAVREGGIGEIPPSGRFGGISNFGLLYTENPDGDVSLITREDAWIGGTIEASRNLVIGGNAYVRGSLFVNELIKTRTGDVIIRLGR